MPNAPTAASAAAAIEPRTIAISADALDALERIARIRREVVTSDKVQAHNREEVRSYAVDVVNAIFRANPEFDGFGRPVSR